jgi:hypothetical protein
LTITPASATQITVLLSTGTGACSRRIASQTIPPVATTSSIALASAARIVEPRRP